MVFRLLTLCGPHLDELFHECGRVSLSHDDPRYVGAHLVSNNTAELQGMLEALLCVASEFEFYSHPL